MINVAGHRLGTREIEESISSHPKIAEVAVVGVADQVGAQMLALGTRVLGFPTDGAVSIPGPIALTATCGNPTAAAAVYDLVLSPAGQELMRQGDMYSVLPSIPPPDGAPPLNTLAVRPWTPELVTQTMTNQSAIKKRWAEGE